MSHFLDRRSAAGLALALLIVLLSNGQGKAQPGSSLYIDATIVDEAGKPVFQANLTLENLTYNLRRSGVSNNEGRFSFERLRGGAYTLRVVASGFKDQSQTIELFDDPRQVRIVLSRTDQEKSQQATPSEQAVVAASTLRAPGKARKEYERGAQAQGRADYPTAHKHADKAIKLYPEFADAYALNGLVYLQEQKLEHAEAAFEKALSIEPQLPEGLLGLGRLRNYQSRFADAEDYLLQAAKGSPGAWQINSELGRTYFGLRKNAEAERYLRHARAVNPPSPSVYLMLAQVLLLLDRPLEAVPEMEAYLRLAPESPTADRVRDAIRRIKATQAQPAVAKDPLVPSSHGRRPGG